MRRKFVYVAALVVILLNICGFYPQNSNYILQFNTESYNFSSLKQVLSQASCKIIDTYSPCGSQYVWLEIKTAQSTPVLRLLEKLRLDYNLNYSEIAYRPSGAAAPDDPYYKHGGQEYLKRLGIEAAWEKHSGNSRILVAIIDTGIDIYHADLEHVFSNKGDKPYDSIDNDNNGYVDDIQGWNFISNGNNIEDDNGHGTHVAGIIGATTGNGLGIAGIAGGGFLQKGKLQSGVILIPLKTANQNNQHDSNIVIARAVDLAVKYKARIINLSLQTTADPPVENDPLYQSLSRAAAKGLVLIASSGNTTDLQYANLDSWKKYNILNNHPDVISVSATEVDKNGNVRIAKWLSSNGSPVYACYGKSVDISAPGKGILSCVPSLKESSTSYARFSGTSMAAAMVSGAASLVLSKNFRLNNRQVYNILIASAIPLYVFGGGSGEINFERAMRITPPILEPFVDLTKQLLQGLPKSYRKRARKIIARTQKNQKELDESSIYDLRIALVSDYYKTRRSKAF